MKKIVIVGLMQDTNFGESIYPKTLEYLISRETGEQYEYVEMDLYGRTTCCEDNNTLVKTDRLKYSVDVNAFTRFHIRTIRFCGRKLNRRMEAKHQEWKCNPNQQKRLRKYYTETMQGASMILFAGGGIIECSTNHDYYHHIDLVTEIADKMEIPVCFNGVGMVIDPNHMFGWDVMKKALNRKCVKYMSCRDGQEWLNQNVFDGKDFVVTVPCSAILSKDGFQVAHNEQSNVIGIGVIRGNIFSSYEKAFSEEQLLELYSGIFRALKKRGYDCRFFTNGYSKDILFAQKLMEQLKEYAPEFDVPENAEDLIKLIAGYQAIITARLHSCIVAYSLGVPITAITWTKKVLDFMELIGEKESAVPLEKLNVEYMIKMFDETLHKDFDQEIYTALEQRLSHEVRKIMSFLK